MERFGSLTRALEKLLGVSGRSVVAASLEDLLSKCGGRCVVRVDAPWGMVELMIVDGRVVASRLLKGGEVVHGEAVVEELRRLLPGVAVVYELPERLLEWRDEEFTVYIRGIDLQHKQLVKLFNSLYRALVEDKPSYAFEAVNFMKEYSVFHFGTEERLFEKYGYPGAEEHRRQHAYFIKEVEGFANQLREGAGLDTALEMLGFLAHWIRVHIQGSDREYGRWLVERGFVKRPVV